MNKPTSNSLNRPVQSASCPACKDASSRPAGPSGPAQPANENQKASARFSRPIFIVSSPRSGSSLLFETLALSPSVWTIGGESHGIIENIEKFHPSAHDYESNRLTGADVDAESLSRLERDFFSRLRDRDGCAPSADARQLRLLEKTPKNSLRVPFLVAAFPDAQFVYLYRDPRETVSSMLDAWKSRRFVTYPHLPGWSGPPWSMALVPGWSDLAGRPTAEIAARQWEIVTNILLDDLESLPSLNWCVASYDRLVSEPRQEIERICHFLAIAWDRTIEPPLPVSRHTLTSPEPDKWRHNASALRPVMPLVVHTAERARRFFASPPPTRPARRRSPAEAPPKRTMRVRPDLQVAGSMPGILPGAAAAAHSLFLPESRSSVPAADPHAFRSVYTAGLPELFEQLGVSLLVSTYQSGRVVAVRTDGDSLNTHFRAFPSPMGLALTPKSLIIGTRHHVWDYHNQPAVARKLAPAGKHDACFLPRSCHITGDVRIHEVAFVENEVWIVATRFSCLATLDREHSFLPRWRPQFVTALSAEDRCHLNGIAVVDGKVRYVTALGETDTPQGWRERKANGGCLIEVDSGEVICRGLSMPHSPRWYGGRLWFLESGKGALALLDPSSGKVKTVAQMPGFTRGLAFAGPFAFVGLSQVRESVFDGIPIARQLAERCCGVWVIDLRSGQIAGFLRFEETVQEIFDILVLPGIRYPEVAEPESDLVGSSFVLPKEALGDVPAGQLS